MMDRYGLGRLERLPARKAWTGEATDFSPWLAENVDLLGSALGLALTLRAREHQVGRYWLDLLLEDARGRTVIVENQFDLTDHDHLGKLMTYAAGTKADVVVWLAEAFTDEHLAALEWLNLSTIPGVGFFAVQLELLQIGDNRAPHFQVLVRPNEWAQTARREAAERTEWSWETYGAQLRVSEDRLAIGQRLVEALEAAIEERGLPWQKQFRKGYVPFQRPGGYNVAVVDIYSRSSVKFAVKLPASPDELSLQNPYPDLPWSWSANNEELTWLVPGPLPDVGRAIDITLPFQPASGPMRLPGVTRAEGPTPLASGQAETDAFVESAGERQFGVPEARLEAGRDTSEHR